MLLEPSGRENFDATGRPATTLRVAGEEVNRAITQDDSRRYLSRPLSRAATPSSLSERTAPRRQFRTKRLDYAYHEGLGYA